MRHPPVGQTAIYQVRFKQAVLHDAILFKLTFGVRLGDPHLGLLVPRRHSASPPSFRIFK